jgi:leucyl aminopeptidase (aminopeptidase T)
VPTGSEAFHLLTPTGACAVTLAAPTPTTHDGKRVNIKNMSTNTITITPTSSTIDGQSTFTMPYQYSSVTLLAYGGAWYVV